MKYKIDSCPFCGKEMWLHGPSEKDAGKDTLTRRCSACGKYVKLDLAVKCPKCGERVELEKPRCYIGANSVR